jgi:hypothetical protein
VIINEDIPQELVTAIEVLSNDDVELLDSVVVLYRYTDSEGRESWNFHARGDTRITSTIGLMEVVKLRMMTPSLYEALDQFGFEIEDD